MTTVSDEPSDASAEPIVPARPRLKYGEILIRIGNGGDDAGPPTEYQVGTFRCVPEEISEVTASAFEMIATDMREAHQVWADAGGTGSAPVERTFGRHHRDRPTQGSSHDR